MFGNTSIKYGHPFIGVDWGTTNFRAYLIGKSGELLNETACSCSLANTSVDRQIDLLVDKVEFLKRDFFVENESHIPVLIIGMAGSSIGLKNIDYLPLDVSLNQLYRKVESTRVGDLCVSFVPGVKGMSRFNELEVMRGEETQILGWMLEKEQEAVISHCNSQSMLLCLPGTHTKWVEYENGNIRQFSTVPSGEIFAKLSNETSLCSLRQVESLEAFRHGVLRTSKGERFSEVVFSTRTRVLSGEMPDEHAASYLSGVLIGSEIYSQLEGREIDSVQIIGNENLNQLYQVALEIYNVSVQCFSSDLLARKAMNHIMSQLTLSDSLNVNVNIKEA